LRVRREQRTNSREPFREGPDDLGSTRGAAWLVGFASEAEGDGTFSLQLAEGSAEDVPDEVREIGSVDPHSAEVPGEQGDLQVGQQLAHGVPRRQRLVARFGRAQELLVCLAERIDHR
jgi:hypothetical protein